MILEVDYDQGKPNALMWRESLSVPLNNQSVTMGNAGPIELKENRSLWPTDTSKCFLRRDAHYGGFP